jgi:hypothetical protein
VVDQVEAVLAAVPEFADRYLALVEAGDGDPGGAAVFAELGDYVAGLLVDPAHHWGELVRCLAAVEAVADGSEDGQDIVAWSFLDGLPPVDRHALEPFLGPCTRSLLAEVDSGSH